MADFLLELRSEEIPARMQAKAREDLARLFAAELATAGLTPGAVTTFATPRRLALIARDLPLETAATSEETKGPKVGAPPQALEGFLRKTGLTQDQLTTRDGVYFAVVERAGQATADVLARAVPVIIRGFPWPKSMRWGAASTSTESLRWVRPLQGIVALLGEDVVPCEIAGIASGRETMGHRFHSTGPIAITSAATYADQLRDAHVIVDQDERAQIIAIGAKMAARKAGLELIEDAGLLVENAGLTEWPVPLLGRFDEAFLSVPPEVIQLTARVNQKYFVCQSSPSSLGEGDHAQHGGGGRTEAAVVTVPLHHQPAAGGPPPRDKLGEELTLANAFICTANIDAEDGGAKIVEGNRKVLAARLSDAKFFYDTDLKVPLEEQATKLDRIVFHEKLGTVADKVARVAKLARWLVEEGIVTARAPAEAGALASDALHDPALRPAPEHVAQLAHLAERAAQLCKADLVTGMVGEFPELQGVMGGYYAAAQGEDPRVAAAIRDHYKPVGQGDEVPTDPVTVAVSLADKLDTAFGFSSAGMMPSGSSDPYAIRRSAIGILRLLVANNLRLPVRMAIPVWYRMLSSMRVEVHEDILFPALVTATKVYEGPHSNFVYVIRQLDSESADWINGSLSYFRADDAEYDVPITSEDMPGNIESYATSKDIAEVVTRFFADRLKVQQREAGVRHDLIDAVFALGGEDDLVRLLARVHALQAFIGTEDGANLLAGYKRAANILKKEGWDSGAPAQAGALGGERDASDPTLRPSPEHDAGGSLSLSYSPEPAEAALIAALDLAAPTAQAAVEREDFEGAMAALASLRGPIDAFFESVIVNDADPARRSARLALLERVRSAVHNVADFSKIEG